MGTTSASIDVQEVRALEAESLSLVQSTQTISIVSHDDYLSAGEHSKSLSRAMKQVEALFKEPIDAAYQTHKSICAAKNKLFDPLKAAKLLCDEKVKVYLQALRRKEAEEAEARRKKMEEEAAALAAAKAADSKITTLAETLKQRGFEEEAAALMEGLKQEPPPPPPSVKPIEPATKVEGLHLRSVWKAEVIDPMALIQEVAAGRQPIHFITINEQALNKMASALRGEMRIPGVKAVEQTSVVNRVQ